MMKRHAMTLMKRACTLLFSLCLLAGNVAYSACENGEQLEVQTEYDPIDEEYTYSVDVCYWLYEQASGSSYGISLTLFQDKHNKPDTPDLRLQLYIGYFPDDWLSADGFLFHADGNRVMEMRDIDFEKKDGLKTGSKYESYRLPLTSKDIAAMRKVASSKKTILRLYGKHHHQDLKVTVNQKLALRLMLEKHDELKGKQP